MRLLQYVKDICRQQCTTTAMLAVVVLIFQSSCSDSTKSGTLHIDDVSRMPIMSTYDVSTLISDSGRVSYRLDAKEWFVFDKTDPQYWAFEKGLYLEKYDREMNIEATIECDTAYYYNEKRLWELIGNVNIMNTNNERFFTDLLYWDQEKELIYSDAYIKIEQEKQTTEGYGFSSNQSMSVWEIKNTKGIYTIEE